MISSCTLRMITKIRGLKAENNSEKILINSFDDLTLILYDMEIQKNAKQS